MTQLADFINFRTQINSIFKCIEFSIREQGQLPALILIYSLIDIFAWLNRADAHEDVTRVDFINWCDQFLFPRYSCEAKSIDLYSARCAILHSATPSSRLVRDGNAKPINYCMGTETIESFKADVSPYKSSNYNGVYIKIEELYNALHDGFELYIEYEFADGRRKSRFLSRIQKYYANIIT